MKKHLIFLLTGVMIFGMVSCGESKKTSAEPETKTEEKKKRQKRKKRMKPTKMSLTLQKVRYLTKSPHFIVRLS